MMTFNQTITKILEEANDILGCEILSELSQINSRPLKVRLINELVNLKKINANIHVEYIESKNLYSNSNNTIKFHFIMNVSIMLVDDNNLYKFEISSDYPFRSPKKFTINHRPYIEYLKINSSKTMKELQLYKGVGCLCCNSVSCASKWTITTNISKCIDEFKIFMQYRRDIINVLLSEKIKERYLLKDIDLLQWLQ
jgi:hypothetical protein